MTVNLELNCKPKADGTHAIYYRITHNRKSKRIDSKKSINRSYWKKRSGQKRYYLSKKAPGFKEIEKYRLHLEQELGKIVQENQILDLFAILEIYNGKQKRGMGEVGFFKYSIDFINKLSLESESGYYRSMTVCIRNFAEFQFEKVYTSKELREYKVKYEIQFSSITLKTLNDFEHWLKVKGLQTNTIYTNLKTLRTIYNRAVKEDVFEPKVNPFKRKTLKIAKTKKKAISIEDIRKIETCKIDDEKVDLARNMFLFSFYCAGLRWGDVCTLQWKNINDGVLRLVTRKTASSNSAEKKFSLDKRAKKILEKYRNKLSKEQDYIFPMLSSGRASLEVKIGSKNALVNSRLKQVAMLANVTNDLSFHMSRHSFATLALDRDTPIAIISQLLGHSDIKTTQIYLKELDYKRVSEAHMNILDY